MPYLKTLEIIMTDSECFVQSQGVTRCSSAVGNRLSVYDSVILGGFLLGHMVYGLLHNINTSQSHGTTRVRGSSMVFPVDITPSRYCS